MHNLCVHLLPYNSLHHWQVPVRCQPPTRRKGKLDTPKKQLIEKSRALWVEAVNGQAGNHPVKLWYKALATGVSRGQGPPRLQTVSCSLFGMGAKLWISGIVTNYVSLQ